MRILNVAYPFAPTGPDAVGGAEQVLSQIDRALTEAGHDSFVLACRGSTVFGTLLEAPGVPREINDEYKRAFYPLYQADIQASAERLNIDAVHFHGVDFHEYLPRLEIPRMATLHLPPGWYAAKIFESNDAPLWLHCVSEAQHKICPPCDAMLAPIGNGVAVPQRIPHAKRNFALAMGRICAEKGFDRAIDAAKNAGIPLLLAGEVFPYEAHRQHFRDAIEPRLDAERRFIGPIGSRRKMRLLAAARCLLISSLVAETSSLAAMEALACGTPVVAFRRGALPEIIEHGRTGFLVDSLAEMAEAIQRVELLSPEDCRAAARERFSASRMTAQYLARYKELIARSRNERNFGERELAFA